VLAAVVLAVILVGAWYGYGQFWGAKTAPASTLKTATVRTGDITLSATGSGSLIPAKEAKLAFKSNGRLTSVNVNLGDRVDVGQVLAQLDDSEVRVQVAQAQATLRLAEIKLEDLTASADKVTLAAAQTNLASAQADLVRISAPPTAQDITAAEANLLSAQKTLETLLKGPTAEDRDIARIDLETAKQNLDQANNKRLEVQINRDGACGNGKNPEYVCEAANADILVAEVAVDQAQGAYKKAQLNYDLKLRGASDEQVAAAQSKVAQTQGQLDNLRKGADPSALAAANSKVSQMQAQLDSVLAGASSKDVESAHIAVEQARNNLALAQSQLENTRMIAPFAGTITGLSARIGEMAGLAPLVTIADLAQSQVQFFVEENDLPLVKVGYPVEVSFSALPDTPIAGRISSVSPALSIKDSVPSAEVIAGLTETKDSVPLLVGMGADVKVTAASANGVLIVPVEALRTMGTNKYGVMTVGAGDQLTLQPVEIGIQDSSYVEIKSGVSRGEVVSTGNVATK
jgi:RND family efflux transporter MFP subunit